MDDHKIIPLMAGWHFSESSRQNGISHYVLVTPSGVAGSEEYHEDELKDLVEAKARIFPALNDLSEKIGQFTVDYATGMALDGDEDNLRMAIAHFLALVTGMSVDEAKRI